jgi:formate hydrogenlyase subunit 6/NADH:ubiquinone oxidoreductase subunit I
MAHMGKDCAAPKEICLTFGLVADSLIRHGFARKADSSEGMDLLQQAYGLNLVQCGENVRRNVHFICNCCGCCCEGLIAARKLGHLHPVWTTNYLPEILPSLCSGCGKCIEICPVAALSLSVEDAARPGKRRAVIDEAVCLGCGICVRNCSGGAIRLGPRAERVITPADSVHRTVVMAIERGLLQNLIFDNQALRSHRALAAILGAILRLSPVKRVLASRQLQSRWLESVIDLGAKRGGWRQQWLEPPHPGYRRDFPDDSRHSRNEKRLRGSSAVDFHR